jgi:hypothetical protein
LKQGRRLRKGGFKEMVARAGFSVSWGGARRNGEDGLILAVRTQAGDFDLAAPDCKPVPVGQLFFHPFEAAVFEFDGFSAFFAAQVTVILVTVDLLVVHVAVFQIGFLNQAGLEQVGDQAVYGGLGDSLAFVSHPQIEFIDIEVFMAGKDLRNDGFAFRGVAKALFADERPEHL